MNWLKENRWRLLLTVILAVLWFLIGLLISPVDTESAKAQSVTQTYLEKSYARNNTQYFENKLPVAVVDYDLRDPEFMATTRRTYDGVFHISFNPFYVSAERYAELTMLHEMCHIKTWNDQHGARWQDCMIQLDLQGRDELIDSYQQK
jgi:predicted SprT family Zn-dependent metalloprotease